MLRIASNALSASSAGESFDNEQRRQLMNFPEVCFALPGSDVVLFFGLVLKCPTLFFFIGSRWQGEDVGGRNTPFCETELTLFCLCACVCGLD